MKTSLLRLHVKSRHNCPAWQAKWIWKRQISRATEMKSLREHLHREKIEKEGREGARKHLLPERERVLATNIPELLSSVMSCFRATCLPPGRCLHEIVCLPVCLLTSFSFLSCLSIFLFFFISAHTHTHCLKACTQVDWLFTRTGPDASYELNAGSK